MSQTASTCADCGNGVRTHGRGLCIRCYSKHRRAGTLETYPSTKRRRAVGDVCRNGHLIATDDDLIDTCRGGVTCRECRRETQARHDSKRGRRSAAHTCDRCGIERPIAGLCRDCRAVA